MAIALAVFVLECGVAVAATPGPGLQVESFAVPTSFSADENNQCEVIGRTGVVAASSCDGYDVTVTNVGSKPTNGVPIAIMDLLPAGLAVKQVRFYWTGEEGNLAEQGLCSTAPVRCEFPEVLKPDETLKMLVSVTVEPGAAASLTNTVDVSGGGAGEATTSATNANGSPAVLFGVNEFDSFIGGVDGALDTQAGAHPYEYTQTIGLDNVYKYGPEPEQRYSSPQDVKDVAVDLPLGLVGSALAAPTCTLEQLSGPGECPPDTQVGHILTDDGAGTTDVDGPLFNMVPEHGVAAEFGYIDILKISHVIYVRVVASPEGYVLQASSTGVPQVVLRHIVVTLYGNPAARAGLRNTQVAQFTNPSSCSGEPLTAAVHIDSWQNPGSLNADGTLNLADPNWIGATSETPPVTGCDLLQFQGSLTAQPETTQGSSPTGLGVELKVPQDEDPNALATPPLRTAVVTLPAGLAVNPSAADGLQTCSMAQIGLGNNDQPTCPEASKIASVELETPALAGVLEGSVYLAAQNENPFGTLLAGYIVVDDPTTGLLVKIPGRIDPDPTTGQLVATFAESPQFPFSDLKLHFFGGPRAPLATPADCGTYTTNSVLTPWSAPDSGPPSTSSDSFQIDAGCGGGFNPAFNAGTVDNQAGGFSAFTTTFSRQDGEQNLSGVTLTVPPGLLGILKGIERCPEPQASQGACGPNSLIGHTTVAAGTGPTPYWVQGGQVFLTGPYKGAPFGLSVVVPAVAGPFNLGNVVVRAAVSVDPHTAQITVASDPLPRILDGIPLDIRTVNVTIDRPGFMFNPTSCAPLAVTGALSSAQGTTTAVSSRFQAANCQGLPFKPVFSVSTQAKTSKHNGASLTVKGNFPTGNANIHSVAVVLPKQLPARLTTIQQACPEAVFAANPATCPTGSMIGTATASTPILANPVVGPTYLVSHGGAAFPDVVAVLQGEGVTVDLVGSVNIKKGITSSDFATVPDAPISTFQLSLPEGPHSGLAAVLPAKAKGDMCGTSLTMPFTITGQNGAQLKQNVKIAVTGCPAPKKKHANKTAHKAHAKKKG